ncbi:hypothetical protein SOCEGT47_013000 [Sorangium cellulosum]|uniref:Uncharacterized protein n=1 Tax=Sorangium cellulosum TaxID=56 RepID=A0A4P2PWE9_SORCE|nr:hypothetical protein [Sorangium cellulosum]AUX20826.1 hypothetical protein SOCEGT47_013000 [Sorangium cellulosum]
MRPRKAAARVIEELPPDEDTADAIPPDDAADGAMALAGEPLSTERLCLDCGSSSGAYDGCPHRERARLHAPPRGAAELVARLRRAAAEHRAAARALRALVMAEHARGRADLETEAEAADAPPPPEAAAPRPEPEAPPPQAACPRCGERAGGEPADAGAPPRRPRRKARVALEQQVFSFTRDAGERPAPGS